MLTSQTRLGRLSSAPQLTIHPLGSLQHTPERLSNKRPRAAAPTVEVDLASVSTLSEAERTALARSYGYRSIGKELPEDVTLGKIVQTLPDEVFEIDDFKAWRAVALTIGAVAGSLWLIGHSPWYLLPFSFALAGTAATGLFVVGHDCGHRSFSKNKLLEDIVGTLMFAPLIYPFEPWRIKHNHHHAHTNKLGEDTAWHPMTAGEVKQWSPLTSGLVTFFLASPLKCWASIGHWVLWHFDSNLYTPKQMKRVVWSWAAVAAFVGIAMPLIVANFGWVGLAKYWAVPWLGYHFWMSTFTVVHHTAPHIPFKKAEDWNAAKAQLSGSVHCDYPSWVDVLTHDISWHVPHHVSSKIPWYNLRKATNSLRKNWGDYMTECRFNWRIMKTVFTELHVYNEDKNYVSIDSIDSDKESPFMALQRKFIPEGAEY